MASSTIPNSAGPGSSIELSEVTIAVRDKVIEKFADEPLDKMNESVKMLLNHEQDEQKRLGILAARVYILRQRIAKLSEVDNERVVTSAAPKPEADTAKTESQDAGDENASEWTRLRILEDCEVNGVRFPKTVIIDVKSEDAAKLIENGNAELIEEKPAEATMAQMQMPVTPPLLLTLLPMRVLMPTQATASMFRPFRQTLQKRRHHPLPNQRLQLKMWPVMLMGQRMICPSWPPHSPSQKTTTQKMSCRILPLP